jgi:DNA-binding transcriptional MerR regulator
LDKAPDAFRTISEVAEDLDIPQHVLRFWETRFTQIKPMKRSGGRRYYRPDDVDLLRGIRRLLYGEGYTIRGVQRILKEHGIKSVQALIDESSAAPSFGAANEAAMRGPVAAAGEAAEADVADEEDDIPEPAVAARHAPEFVASPPRADRSQGPSPAPPVAAATGDNAGGRQLDTAKLQAALQDLIACRQLLDAALKDR